MAKIIIHQSPQGPLEIVGVAGAIEPGQPFEVTDSIAESLLVQADLYHRASKAEIQEYADRKAAEAAAAEAAQTEGAPE